MPFERRQSRPYDPTLRKEYTHSETTCQLDEATRVEISKEGRVVIEQSGKDEEGLETYDEINISAAHVFRIAALLNETRSTKLVPRESKRNA